MNAEAALRWHLGCQRVAAVTSRDHCRNISAEAWGAAAWGAPVLSTEFASTRAPAEIDVPGLITAPKNLRRVGLQHCLCACDRAASAAAPAQQQPPAEQ